MLTRWTAAASRRIHAVGAAGTRGPGLSGRDGADDVADDARAPAEHNVDRGRNESTGRRTARGNRKTQGRAVGGASVGRRMMSTWLSAAAALAAIALTYLICVRPHLPGRALAVQSHSKNQAVDRQLADLRDELRALRRLTTGSAFIQRLATEP